MLQCRLPRAGEVQTPAQECRAPCYSLQAGIFCYYFFFNIPLEFETVSRNFFWKGNKPINYSTVFAGRQKKRIQDCLNVLFADLDSLLVMLFKHLGLQGGEFLFIYFISCQLTNCKTFRGSSYLPQNHWDGKIYPCVSTIPPAFAWGNWKASCFPSSAWQYPEHSAIHPLIWDS